MMPAGGLTNSEAGWITAIFYAAYMVAVPILVTLTDRIDAKRVYLFGVGCTIAGPSAVRPASRRLLVGAWRLRALAGIGWAGTYMTGLKLLADQVDAKLMSRAVTGHAASIGISGALSFLCADLLADMTSAGSPPSWSPRERGCRVADGGAGRCRAAQPPGRGPPAGTGAVRFSSGVAQPLGHGLCARLLRPHAGDERAARLGRGVSGVRRGAHRRCRARFRRRSSSPRSA